MYRAEPRRRVVVRKTRGGRALRVDGTFASFWRPGETATGSVWDALALPILALPAPRRRRVLLLGLGGGSVARLVRELAPRARIVGVEIDPEVVRAARRWFELDALGVEVHRTDARRFLARSRERFDVVLDDVFVGSGRRVRKPDWLPLPGLEAAARRVAPNGILATNTLDERPESLRALRRLFPSLLEIEVDGYDNRILAGSRAAGRDADVVLDARALRRAAAKTPCLAGTLPRLRLRTR